MRESLATREEYYYPIPVVGHVIYEMSSGHVLSGVVPTEEEYERVESDEVKELLQFIFNLVVSLSRESGWREMISRKLTPKIMVKKVSIIIFHCMFDMILYTSPLIIDQRTQIL